MAKGRLRCAYDARHCVSSVRECVVVSWRRQAGYERCIAAGSRFLAFIHTHSLAAASELANKMHDLSFLARLLFAA